MRVGLNSVVNPDHVEFGDFTDVWDDGDGNTAYCYDGVTLTGSPTKTASGAVLTGALRGSVETGDLVKIDSIPMGHRELSHRSWAVGPVQAVWATPRKMVDGEQVDLDANSFDPTNLDEWPGVSVSVEVRAPKLGGDVPVTNVEVVETVPNIYQELLDGQEHGLWVKEPVDGSFHRPTHSQLTPDMDDVEYVTTDGNFELYQDMRSELYALPESDSNADDSAPNTSRPYSVSVVNNGVKVTLMWYEDGGGEPNGEDRMWDVADDFEAEVNLVEQDKSTGRRVYNLTL